jgi:peptidoglycan/xylan/chitin deacetylase (PgdA/CDA1 family)
VALLALVLTVGAVATAIAVRPKGHKQQGGRPATSKTPPPARHYPRSRRAVPVLMYHVIGQPTGPYPALYVRPAIFAAQMRWLAQHGYRAVTLARLEDAWTGRAALPGRPVVLSFDDGYKGDVRYALPTLRRLGWAGELNLVLTNLDTEGGLSRTDVRRLIGAGWELGAHTINHVDLTTLAAPVVGHEVGGSRKVLREIFHVPVANFAYPSGKFDPVAVRAVRRAGFRGALTVAPGLARRSQRFTMNRVRVDDTMTAAGLGATLGALER